MNPVNILIYLAIVFLAIKIWEMVGGFVVRVIIFIVLIGLADSMFNLGIF